jgi:hypothetical protein
MKIHFAAALVLAFLLGDMAFLPLTMAQEVTGQKTGSPVMSEPVSAEELSNRLRHARQHDPIRKLVPPGNPGSDPSRGMHGRDLIAESTVLNYGGLMTLVPKRSVLHLPEALESRVGTKDGAEFQPWSKFFEVNRSWLHAEPVTRERALGKTPFSAEERNALRSSGKIIIATYKGGPISVLPTAFTEESGDGERSGESTLRTKPDPGGPSVTAQP